MRTICVNRSRNVYTVGYAETGNGFTYTNGAAKDDTPNNCRFSGGQLKWKHARPINTMNSWVGNEAGALQHARECAEENNMRYACPFAVADSRGKIVALYDTWVTDPQTGMPMKKDYYKALEAQRGIEKENRRKAAAEAEKNAHFESELR
jgi:hypothetical protein